MLAACGAEGVTVISNAAREPEVVDLQNFLNACGARVSGAGSSAVSIEGGQDLHGCTYRVMPDRIAAATYLCAAASAGGDIYLRGAEEGHLSTVTARPAGGGLHGHGRQRRHPGSVPGAAAGRGAGADGALPRLSNGRAGGADGGTAAQPGRHGI